MFCVCKDISMEGVKKSRIPHGDNLSLYEGQIYLQQQTCPGWVLDKELH